MQISLKLMMQPSKEFATQVVNKGSKCETQFHDNLYMYVLIRICIFPNWTFLWTPFILLNWNSQSCIYFFLAFMFSEFQCYCGQRRRKNTGQRIYGGQASKRNEYPWMVRLKENTHCGGALINSRWVLTSAGCVDYGHMVNGTMVPLDIDYVPDDMVVILGDHELSDSTGDEVEMEVSKIIKHPKVTLVDGVYQFDVALLKLKKDMDFVKHPHIRPVCLPKDSEEEYVGRRAMVTGWGMKEQDVYPDKLQFITGVVRSNLECSKMKMGCKGNTECAVSGIPDNMLCVTHHGGKICMEDFGGPLVTKSDGKNYEQIGVAAFTWLGCNHTGYGGYARVTSVLSWIKDSVGTGHTDCPRK